MRVLGLGGEVGLRSALGRKDQEILSRNEVGRAICPRSKLPITR